MLGRWSIFLGAAACLILLSCSVRHIVYPAPAVSVADPAALAQCGVEPRGRQPDLGLGP